MTNSILEKTTSVVQLQLLLWQTDCKCLVVLGDFIKSLDVANCNVVHYAFEMEKEAWLKKEKILF